MLRICVPSGVPAATTTSNVTANDSPGAITPPPFGNFGSAPGGNVAPLPTRKRTALPGASSA